MKKSQNMLKSNLHGLAYTIFFLKVKCEHNIEAKDLREKCHMGANWLLMSVALHYLNSSSLSHVKKPVPFSGLANLLEIHNIGLIDLYSIPKHLVLLP